jgi:excisionase family DNA binding protein
MRKNNRTGRNHSQFLTLTEVQAYLGIRSRKTILKYICNGRLPAYKIGGTRWRIRRSDIANFLTHHQVTHSEVTHAHE